MTLLRPITDQLALSSSILPLCYSCSNSLTAKWRANVLFKSCLQSQGHIFQSKPLAYASGRRVDLKNENAVTSDLSVSHCIGCPGSALLRNTIQIYHQLYITIKHVLNTRMHVKLVLANNHMPGKNTSYDESKYIYSATVPVPGIGETLCYSCRDIDDDGICGEDVDSSSPLMATTVCKEGCQVSGYSKSILSDSSTA